MISPKVVYAQTSTIRDKEKTIILTESSQFFSARSIVSIYYKKEKLEVLVCVGIVETIQSDGRIQISLSDSVKGYEDIYSSIGGANKDVLEKLLIKPTLPEQYMN
ncbi:hypothetical protein [Maridesulfovibrio sp.]|uniref:hypothetical protein n=1 Tax=unclassified Maridesulfovibrio TaxID=2794999 RepID=UPI003AFFA61F